MNTQIPSVIYTQVHSPSALPAALFFVPFLLFAGWIAWLVVPAVVEAVVPAVVQSVVPAVVDTLASR